MSHFDIDFFLDTHRMNALIALVTRAIIDSFYRILNYFQCLAAQLTRFVRGGHLAKHFEARLCGWFKTGKWASGRDEEFHEQKRQVRDFVSSVERISRRSFVKVPAFCRRSSVKTKIGFNQAEKEPCKVCTLSMYRYHYYTPPVTA